MRAAMSAVATGEIVEWSVDYVVIEHPQLGTVRLALDDLKIDRGTAVRDLTDSEVVKIKYKSARLYYIHNQFEEAATRIV